MVKEGEKKKRKKRRPSRRARLSIVPPRSILGPVVYAARRAENPQDRARQCHDGLNLSPSCFQLQTRHEAGRVPCTSRLRFRSPASHATVGDATDVRATEQADSLTSLPSAGLGKGAGQAVTHEGGERVIRRALWIEDAV